MNLPIVTTAAELKAQIAAWRKDRQRIALVPTMGALHEGHLSLVREARLRADRVVVSIFVNPTQFAPQEDFSRYPRMLEDDRAKLGLGAGHLIYAPSVREMYPEGRIKKIEVAGPSEGLESDFRPHFFRGVATVVATLFRHCQPDVALFGEKDYQQLLVVRRMVEDLGLAIEIAAAPTVREKDGLALSSRNAYLDAKERKIAGQLNMALQRTAKRAKTGISIPVAEAEGQAALLTAGFARVDYVAIRDAETLRTIRALDHPARILAAAYIGTTRLIDNMAV